MIDLTKISVENKDWGKVKATLLSKNKNVVVLTGAGISLDSGLPLASTLIEYLLGDMSVMSKSLMHHVLTLKDMPFEGYIEYMVNFTNDYSLFNIFTNTSLEPNENHIALAHLLKSEIISRIYTANFDLLHEKSIDYVKYRYSKVYSDEDFTNETYEDKCINLVKLHGCASDIESMKIQLSNITASNGRSYRENFVQRLFGDENNIVVILGYSGSDKFDINPAILSLRDENKATVIYVNHTNTKEVNIFENSDNNSIQLFKNFKGFNVTMNCTEFIREWAQGVGVVYLYPEVFHQRCKFNNNNHIWKSSVKNFVNAISDIRFKLLGTIYLKAGYLNESEYYYKKAIETGDTIEFCYKQLAEIALMRKQPSLYIKLIEQAKSAAKQYNNVGVYLSCLFCDAEQNLSQGNSHESISLYLEIYVRSSLLGRIDLMMYAIQGLSTVYAELKEFDRAIFYASIFYDYTSSDENISMKADALINMAELYKVKGDYDLAISYIDQAIDIKENLNDKVPKINAWLVKANIYKNAKLLKESFGCYMKALRIAKEIGARDCNGRIYHQMALLLLEIGNEEIPFLICLYRALQENLILENKIEILSLSELACLFFSNLEFNLKNHLQQDVSIEKYICGLDELMNNSYSIVENEVIVCMRSIKNTTTMTSNQILDAIYRIRSFHTYCLSLQLRVAKEVDAAIYERTIVEKENLGVLCR